MMNKKSKSDKLYVAVLITGTYRELEFLLKLFPYLGGDIKYDMYLILRHVNTDESSRLGAQEKDFSISNLVPFQNKNIFICELPSIDSAVVQSNYLIPVGPTNIDRECGMLSMFYGVFSAISMLKASQRSYTHVMKTRTDYLPWEAPWINSMLKIYKSSKNRIIMDGVVTKPQRYPDRPDIPWQGSINDAFSFSSVDQFLALWDIEPILPKIWTGIPETTLFRAAMMKFLGDDLQSFRRNESFLKKYFIWEHNDTKQSFNLLRAGVISNELKKIILQNLEDQKIICEDANKLIRFTYDYISHHSSYDDPNSPPVIGDSEALKIEDFLKKHFSKNETEIYLKACRSAIKKARAI